MDLIRVFQQFPDHESCLEHLEKVRWGDVPRCPHCNSQKVARKADGVRVGRWNCHECKSSFNVLSKTIFQKTKIPLQKWFLAIALILNARKSLSSNQLARDLDLNQKTAWYMKMRLRDAMVEDSDTFLHGIVEADESCISTDGSKLKHNGDDDDKPKRGRGTKKSPEIGAIERCDKAVAKPSPKFTAATLHKFLKTHVDDDDSVLMTDEFPAYRRLGECAPHFTINHAVRYVEGLIHTYSIEGFWSLLKRALYGQHHHYSRVHASAYIVEACYKYNIRKSANPFADFIRGAVMV